MTTEMKSQYWILFAVLLTACTKNTTVKDSQSANNKQIKNEIELEAVTIVDAVLIDQSVLHEFSQKGKKDEFYICIKGKSITEGKVIFKILSHEGIEILRKEFPSYLLMNYGFRGDLNSALDREEYMKSRIREFFDEKNFTYPAIKQDEVFDEDYSDQEIWNDIQSDQTAIGFSYITGEENGRKIAFSKKKGKVVLYFNCC